MPQEFDVCADGDLPEGGHRLVDVGGGEQVAVFCVGGAYYAVDDICTHDGGSLADGDLEGFEIICPRHQASFDIRNGCVLQPPADENITSYPVRVSAGRVVLTA